MSRTRQGFGKGIWPHLFRDCAVTRKGVRRAPLEELILTGCGSA
jgi:hypothetical protein